MTIKDIARVAGVSVSTVSLVLSNRGYVGDKTRKKVEKVIDDHNYHPRQSARQLASGQTGNIGFIISDIHLSSTEYFYTRVLLGAEIEARTKDYYLLLTTVGDSFHPPGDAPRFLKGQDVDAVIVAGGVPLKLVEYLHQVGIPFVLVDHMHHSLNTNLVLIENFKGALKAVRHLISQDYSRIAFVGGSFRHPSIQERFAGYRSALDEAGLTSPSGDAELQYLIKEETSSQIGYEGICTLLDRGVNIDAVVCGNDTTAIGCLQALHERNIDVPSSVAVVGFDDIMYAAKTAPALTTVHVPKMEMGIQAVRLVFDLLEHPGSGVHTRLIHTDLIVRESSERKYMSTEKKLA